MAGGGGFEGSCLGHRHLGFFCRCLFRPLQVVWACDLAEHPGESQLRGVVVFLNDFLHDVHSLSGSEQVGVGRMGGVFSVLFGFWVQSATPVAIELLLLCLPTGYCSSSWYEREPYMMVQSI